MAKQNCRWTMSFLRELVLSGDARPAADRSGLNYAVVCRRRLREREFAGLWEAALGLREEFPEHLEATPSPGLPMASHPLPQGERGQGGEE